MMSDWGVFWAGFWFFATIATVVYGCKAVAFAKLEAKYKIKISFWKWM